MKDQFDKASEEYAQNLSHELLTPLAVIRSKAELLMQSANLNQDDLNNLDVILKTVNRMSRLNKALILLSKIDNKIFKDMIEIDVNDVVAESLEKFEDQIRLKSLTIRFQKGENTRIKANQTLFEILITNLIKNAVFHNVNEGQINIYSSAEKFVIENDLEGVVDQAIFDRFVTKRKDENALGLGLHIVKKICELFQYDMQHEITDNKFKISVQLKN